MAPESATPQAQTEERPVSDLRTLRNYINGEFVGAADGRTLDIVDPATGEVYATSPLSGAADVDAAMASAAAAFPVWRDATPSTRQKLLLKIADAVEARADEIVDAEVRNTGKPRALTLSEEIGPMVDQIRFFAGAARLLEGKAAGEYMDGMTSIIRREPVGVCAQVAPWNYPMMMAVWKFAPAIAAGNTVVLKPSDTTPASTVLLAEIIGGILKELELPAGVFNVICGDRETGRLMVEHPVPAMASITGSVRAGIQVAESASKDVKRVHLELGGKAPVVVFEDADIAEAVEGISVAGYFNAGQDCTAATRVLVHESIHDAFVEALAKAAAETKTGGADDEDVLYGPLNNANQLKQVSGFIERLPAHAKVEAGGHRVGDKGYFYAATVVSGLNQDDEIVQNEVFGPVITVQKFTDEDQAVEYANGVEYALASSVWTKDHARAMRMSRRLDFGCVWINTHIPLVAEMPHGGFKKSGYGKDLSSYGFEDYTRVKHVMTAI
ncbi:gamma-aminobutyraldehyde dehydrogenase [Kitasatospora cathayae]|uniref:Gamma-aminobutyraldehyde dehydrogenase n=1 Tax=Kitasatospora cathayae TaxID=3004092 RepID=A0ABY7Q260_9ACTN|nr:gamma-aminobutyraldehyde dehydrogenase [Kitasatospora sp. HUAS 3-15]WBP86790.1 gamma-aminobutyraldehyde dehydrogenase [Kitasatospora sp. HUAS 3-15]